MPPRRTRRTLLASALLAAAACSGGDGERPSVVLVTLDTTRADYLSCYGGPPGLTPHLDALAQQGTRFDLAISTAAVTPVSHASLLTGLNNAEHRLRVLSAAGGYRLPEDVPTLATVLGAAGWRTIAVHSAFPVSGYFGFDRGFDRFLSFDETMHEQPTADGGVRHAWELVRHQRRSDETTDLVLAELDGVEGPYFLWAHYWDPHDPALLPPAEDLAQVPRDAEGRLVPGRELYAAEVRYMDRQIGRLLDAIARRDDAQNTIVVVVADHGEGLGDHGWDHHRILYQEQIRVPLIVRVPGARSVPSVGALVRGIDVFPTVLDYAGVRAPRPVRGRSLRALLEGAPDEPRLAYADQINGYDLNAEMVKRRPQDAFLYCAMDARWKLVYRPQLPAASELYAIDRDPLELENRFASERDVAVRLLGELARYNGWVLAPFPPQGDAGDRRLAEGALTTLGYTGSDSLVGAVDWVWTCAEHPDWVSEERALCSRCRGQPLLRAR